MLNDFEDYGTGVEPLLLLNYFGKVSLNTDKEYVKSGERSLKAVPEGCSSEGRYSPILKQPLRIEKSGKGYRDVSRFKMVSTQIYNASDDAVSMKMQMQFFDGYQTNTQTYTLQKGWNTVVYNVDPQILDISYDISDCKGLLYIFDPPRKEPRRRCISTIYAFIFPRENLCLWILRWTKTRSVPSTNYIRNTS